MFFIDLCSAFLIYVDFLIIFNRWRNPRQKLGNFILNTFFFGIIINKTLSTVQYLRIFNIFVFHNIVFSFGREFCSSILRGNVIISIQHSREVLKGFNVIRRSILGLLLTNFYFSELLLEVFVPLPLKLWILEAWRTGGTSGNAYRCLLINLELLIADVLN